LHIVFIVGSYYPNYSAVGKCIGNVADELATNHNVTIICLKSFNEQKNLEMYNNQKIVRVNTYEKKARSRLITNIREKKGPEKEINRVLLSINKVSRFIKTIFSKVTINKELVNAYFEALCEINTSIDLIVPACMPFESVLAAVNFKKYSKEKVKIIPFLFDKFTDNSNLHRIKINKIIKRSRHILLEKEVLLHSDKVLAMHSLRHHFESELSEFNNKITYVEHPLIIKPVITSDRVSNGIQLSYIGGLYKNYVTPNYLLELFSRVNEDNMILNFFIIGNCNRIVERYCKIKPQKIINHGSVAKEEANKAAANSNILISIAEKDGVQMSSKIFEYISLGKPIVHFYSVDNDVNIKILNHYPYCLCLKQDSDRLDENLKKFVTFCNKYKDTFVEFDTIKEVYSDALPKNTANLIIELVK
jgi:hypothetical protein